MYAVFRLLNEALELVGDLFLGDGVLVLELLHVLVALREHGVPDHVVLLNDWNRILFPFREDRLQEVVTFGEERLELAVVRDLVVLLVEVSEWPRRSPHRRAGLVHRGEANFRELEYASKPVETLHSLWTRPLSWTSRLPQSGRKRNCQRAGGRSKQFFPPRCRSPSSCTGGHSPSTRGIRPRPA